MTPTAPRPLSITPRRAQPRRSWAEQVMGLPVSVHLRGPASGSREADECVQAAYDELRAVDILFSPHQPDSQVARLDRGELDMSAAHPLVGEVVELCRTASVLTDGAFDAWCPDRRLGRRRFDPSGLVKGWAVQRAAEHLARSVAADVGVVAGGDLVVSTTGADPARVMGVLPVRSRGVATSGTTHRGQHVVDPGSGELARQLASVTVVGPSLMWADVLATAAFVKGTAALDWLEGLEGYEGLVVAADGHHWTSGWPGQPSTEDMSA